MKILKVKINNFGTLSNYTFEFSEGINTIIEENGSGKTTLAVFIKAMFYGLVDRKTKDIKESERKLYTPWNQKTMGGSLIFSHENKEYKIERIFGETRAKDTFKLYDNQTNNIVTTYSENIGEEIFGLNRDSFEKCCFFPQKDVDNQYSDDIITRLTMLLEKSNDTFTFTEANASINAKIRDYYYTATKGLIPEYENKIASVTQLLKEIELKKEEHQKLLEEINSYQDDLKKKEENLLAIKAKIKEYSLIQSRLEVIEHFNSLEEEISKKEKELNELGSIITDTDLDKIIEISGLLKEVDEKTLKITSSPTFTEDKKQEKFSHLTKEKIDEISDKTKHLQDLKDEEKRNSPKTEEFIHLKEFFTEEFNIDDYSLLKKCIDKSKTLKYNASRSINIILSIIDSILLGLSIFFYNKNPKIFLSLIIAFFVLIVLTFIFFLIKRKEKKQFIKEKTINDNEIEKLLKMFSFDSEINILALESEIDYKVKRYLELKEENNSFELKISKIKENCDIIQNELDSFYLKYLDNLSENYLVNIELLKDSFNKYLKNKELNKSLLKELETLKIKENDLYLELKQILEKLDISLTKDLKKIDELILSLGLKKNNYSLLANNIKELKSKKEKYIIEKKIDEEFFKLDVIDINSLNKSEEETSDLIKELNNLVIKKNNDLLLLEEEISHEDYVINNLNELKRLLSNYQKEHQILEKTRKYLEDAKSNLSKSYITPMTKSFTKYLKELAGDDFDSIVVNTNLDIQVENETGLKEIDYFSRGYKDLMFFCMRLALIENLFKDFGTVLILDDPFVNLDDEKLEKVKKLLKKLEEKYQIIYLICHSSRVGY